MIKNVVFLVLLLPFASFSAEALLRMGGTLKVSAPEFDLTGRLYTAGWKKSVSGIGFVSPDAQGNCPFELKAGDQIKVSCTVTVKQVDADSIHATYRMTPEFDMTLNALFAGFRLPVDKMDGARWKTDTKEGVFPAEYGSSSVFSGRVRRLEVNLALPHTGLLILTFDEPTPVLIQDDRKWGNTFSFRLGNNGEKKYAAGVPFKVAFSLAFSIKESSQLKPMQATISEYNYSAPGMFRGVGGILTGAMGALQDWSALWRFTYSHSLDRMFDGNGAIGYFDLASDPLAQATERASICLFLRGDLSPAQQKVVINLPAAEVSVLKDQVTRVSPDWSWLAWSAQVGTRASGEQPVNSRVLDFKDAYAPEAGSLLSVYTNGVCP